MKKQDPKCKLLRIVVRSFHYNLFFSQYRPEERKNPTTIPNFIVSLQERGTIYYILRYVLKQTPEYLLRYVWQIVRKIGV